MKVADEEIQKVESVERDDSGETLAVKRKLTGKMKIFIYWFAIATSLFHLWVNTIGIMPEIQRNAVHFGAIVFTQR